MIEEFWFFWAFNLVDELLDFKGDLVSGDVVELCETVLTSLWKVSLAKEEFDDVSADDLSNSDKWIIMKRKQIKTPHNV